MSWDSLPEELLTNIFQRLIPDMSDLYQCLAVSTSWRFAAREEWHSTGATTTPWLLIKERCPNEKLNFITVHSKTISFRLPCDKSNLIVHSSYKGWLLLLSLTKEGLISCMYLYNPLTRMLIELPTPFPLLFLRGSHIKKFVTSSSPMDPNCIVGVVRGGAAQYLLMFCTPRHHKNNNEWITLSTHLYWGLFNDIIFYRDQFYVICNDGLLYSYTATSNGKYSFSKVVKAYAGSLGLNVIYLTESKTEELMMVGVMGEHSGRDLEYCFFKFNLSNEKWTEVRGFGNCGHQALFVGTNQSIFVSAEEGDTNFKPSCTHLLKKFPSVPGIVCYEAYDFRRRRNKLFALTIDEFINAHIDAEWFSPSG